MTDFVNNLHNIERPAFLSHTEVFQQTPVDLQTIPNYRIYENSRSDIRKGFKQPNPKARNPLPDQPTVNLLQKLFDPAFMKNLADVEKDKIKATEAKSEEPEIVAKPEAEAKTEAKPEPTPPPIDEFKHNNGILDPDTYTSATKVKRGYYTDNAEISYNKRRLNDPDLPKLNRQQIQTRIINQGWNFAV
jgi:hypothetical protein